MSAISQSAIAQFVRTCRTAGRRGLVRASSGNLSLRIPGGRMLVTASRSWLGNLTPADVAVCRIADGAQLAGKKASVETGFHAGILRARPEVNVVLHFQAPCATTLACRRQGAVNFFVIPEIPFYIGPVARIPYLPPGSEELARAVIAAMRRHDLALLANHGQVTVARDLEHAIQNAEFFELACEIILRGGKQVRPLPAKAAQALRAARRAAGC